MSSRPFKIGNSYYERVTLVNVTLTDIISAIVNATLPIQDLVEVVN